MTTDRLETHRIGTVFEGEVPPPPTNQHPKTITNIVLLVVVGGMVGGGPVASVASPREKTHTLSSS